MEKSEGFEIAARENGFLEVGESEDGSTLWFRKTSPDPDTA
jgi:hypothetical protein